MPGRILIATGVRDELPDIPGVHERWGRDLLHCPYCHGWEVRDQPIGVLGTRPDAVQHALLVRQWSDDIAFFSHTLSLGADDLAQLDARGVSVVSGSVKRLVIEDDRMTGVRLEDGRVIPRAAVFIRPVNVPHADGLVTGLGCEVDGAGFPTVDATGRTTAPGVWAAGTPRIRGFRSSSSAGSGRRLRRSSTQRRSRPGGRHRHREAAAVTLRRRKDQTETGPSALHCGARCGGRYWARTSDLTDVNRAL